MGIPGTVSAAAAVPEALNAVRARGYSLFVVTNPLDMARATSRRGPVHAIHGLRRQAAAGLIVGDGRQ